jgi:Tol biopolymer transport system component
VISPDAKHVLVRDARTSENGDIWRIDLDTGVRSRLTTRQSLGSFPIWSPDGGSIIFSAGNGLDTLLKKSSSGTGEEKELFKKAGEIKVPTSLSQDGRYLLYATAANAKSGADVWLLELNGDHKPVLLLGEPFDEFEASFSPDMRWIAYASNVSGRNEIYVQPFNASSPSGPALGEGRQQISKDGGSKPLWRAEGKEILFRAPDGSPMAVNVNGSGATFHSDLPRQLFPTPYTVGDWDVSADGKRFLMNLPPGQGSADNTITVVMNWQSTLKHQP